MTPYTIPDGLVLTTPGYITNNIHTPVVFFTDLIDWAFALGTCVFHLIDPLVDAVVAILVAATIQ